MTTTTPSTTGGSATSWGINPTLPSGMTFNTATGAISGTPESLQTTAVNTPSGPTIPAVHSLIKSTSPSTIILQPL